MKFIKTLLVIVIILMVVSCDKEINLILPDPPKRLIVEGRIELIKNNITSKQSLTLSTLGNYFSNSPTPRVTNAIVSVTDSQGTRYDYFQNNEIPGLYETNSLVARLGEHYTLTIVWEGQQYEAQETLVSVPPIDSIYQIFEEENQFEDEGIKVAIDFTDPGSDENYYFWELFANGKNTIIPDPGNSQNIVTSDKLFNGKQIIGYLPSEEKVFTPGDVAKVRHIGISKANFDYLYKLLEQTGQTGQVFDIPPAGIKGNIINRTNPKNPPLGYFGAVEIDEEELVIKPI